MAEKILNLCDIGSRICRHGGLEKLLEDMPQVSRIYVGSYFCDRYFTMTVRYVTDCCLPYCLEKNRKITCVVPIPSQENLGSVKESALELLSSWGGLVDTICVNDPGMLLWARENTGLKLTLGRLFSKELRDPRYGEALTPGTYRVSRGREELMEKFGISAMEVEGIYSTLKGCGIYGDYKVYAHRGYCYMSCGRYCLFASVRRELPGKFRTGAPCSLECGEFMMKHLLQNKKEVFRVGKGIYYRAGTEKKLSEDFEGEILFPLERW